MKKEINSTRIAAPKNTFYNLPAEKRRRIEEALVREFADHGYRKASLNRVVKELGIAKGSLYQYFANKEGTFLFVFERFTHLVREMAGKPAVAGAPDDPGRSANDDFWEAVRRVIEAGIVFIDKYPDYYQLYLNALFEHDIPEREAIIRQIRLFSPEYFGPLVEAGQRRGIIRSEVPAELVIFMIDAAMDRFLQSYAHVYLDNGLGLRHDHDRRRLNGTRIQKNIEIMLDVLQHGLANKGGAASKDKKWKR